MGNVVEGNMKVLRCCRLLFLVGSEAGFKDIIVELLCFTACHNKGCLVGLDKVKVISKGMVNVSYLFSFQET